MDELEISGKRYISSRRAGKEHKYHPDYIGQLIRGGKVPGQKVGRAWYVDAEALEGYFRGDFEMMPPAVTPAVPIVTKTQEPPTEVRVEPQKVEAEPELGTYEEPVKAPVYTHVQETRRVTQERPVMITTQQHDDVYEDDAYAYEEEQHIPVTRLQYVQDNAALYPRVQKMATVMPQQPAYETYYEEEYAQPIVSQPAQTQRHTSTGAALPLMTIAFIGALALAIATFLAANTSTVMQTGMNMVSSAHIAFPK